MLIVTACALQKTTAEPSKPHHTADGFVNTNGLSGDGGKNFFSTMWKFASGQFKPKPPTIGYEEFEKQSLTKPSFHNQRDPNLAPTVTWLGHAGVLLQIQGLNLIFDPIFSDRASPVSFAGPVRMVKPAFSLAELPEIDAIFVSHNHFDHLDEQTLLGILKQSKDPKKLCAYVPLKMGEWFRTRGFTCVNELDWWDRLSLGENISVVATPTQHWSRRGLFDRNHVLWAGFLIEAAGAQPFKFIHLGDTGYTQDFKEIGKRFGPIDMAAIPIGAYEPRDFMAMAHISPAEAVQAMKDLNATSALGIHWGTFELTKEALDQPPKDLAIALQAEGLSAEKFFVLKQGETKKMSAQK